MALAFRFSVDARPLPGPGRRARAARAIAAAGLPTSLGQIAGHPFGADRLVGHMAQDKKAEGGALTFILARALGEAFVAKGVERRRRPRLPDRRGSHAMTLEAALIAAAPFILALLAVSAVFSAAETALTRASRGRMHQLERDGDRAAGRVNRLLSDQETHDRRGADRLQRDQYPGLGAGHRVHHPAWCRAPGAWPSPPA